jgi:serine/threonine protein kinase
MEVCSCGLFSAPAQTSTKMPKTLYGSNLKYNGVSKTPPGRISSDIQIETATTSDISTESIYSCNSFDDSFMDMNKNSSLYSDWTFVKCLNENPQSKIDIMKNNITKNKCIRKIYFNKENKNACKYGFNEWKIVSSLSHPNVIKFDYFHKTDKFVAILMPYYKTDLFNKLERDSKTSYFNSPSSISERITTLLTTYYIVKYIHDNDVVHRDLKPENFVLNDSGEPILIDFGYSVQTQNNILRNDRKGTPLYVAPEVYLDKPFDGKATDIFSLGSMSWAVVFGCQPWNDSRTGSFYQTLYSMPINNILIDFQKLVKEMTSEEPKKRPNISECVERLKEINDAYFSCEDVMNEFLLLSN